MRAHLISCAVLAAVSVACAGASSGSSSGMTTDGGTSGSAGSSCSELADAARQEVDGVLQANRACTSASDCAGATLSASCFDSCGRAIRADGKAALEASQAKVDKAQCAQFTTQGCKVIIPPCVPPGAIACVNGMCTN